jgi:hypothetical protein
VPAEVQAVHQNLQPSWAVGEVAVRRTMAVAAEVAEAVQAFMNLVNYGMYLTIADILIHKLV